MREQIINALTQHAKGHIEKHLANIEVYMINPAGIDEHSNILEAIEVELKEIAEYEDQLEVIQKYLVK